MATVVLSIAAAGVLLPFTCGAAERAEGNRRTLAAKLAGDLMEKIVTTPFEQIVPSFNYTESQGQVKNAAGVVFTDSNYANFSRAVNCGQVRMAQETELTEAVFILASVMVYYNGGEIAVINRLISK